MAINLPASPTVNQTITTADGTSYIFDGVRWVRAGIAAPIGSLLDVDTSTSAPKKNEILRFDGTNWVPYSASPNFNTVNTIASGGNTVWTDGRWQYHEFTQDSLDMTFTVLSGVDIFADILIVGGGGGGGSAVGGGGAGGGVALLHGVRLFANSSHTVRVGGYGIAGPGFPNIPAGEGRRGSIGENSTFAAWTAEGGGGGGNGASAVASEPYSGASGGGAGLLVAEGAAAYSSFAMGYPGGGTTSGVNGGGGGGGAGGPGQRAYAQSGNQYGGHGGPGVSVWGYQVGGGGGGGGNENIASSVYGIGATAHGGGSSAFGGPGRAGAPNTGGGGGGGGIIGTEARAGGDGGTGIVVVRYKL